MKRKLLVALVVLVGVAALIHSPAGCAHAVAGSWTWISGLGKGVGQFADALGGGK